MTWPWSRSAFMWHFRCFRKMGGQAHVRALHAAVGFPLVLYHLPPKNLALSPRRSPPKSFERLTAGGPPSAVTTLWQPPLPTPLTWEPLDAPCPLPHSLRLVLSSRLQLTAPLMRRSSVVAPLTIQILQNPLWRHSTHVTRLSLPASPPPSAPIHVHTTGRSHPGH